MWENDRIRVTVKDDKLHEVLITDGIRRILMKNWHRHEEFAFTVRDADVVIGADLPPRTPEIGARPITYDRLYVDFKRIAKLAGVQDITIHDLRRTAGARKYIVEEGLKAKRS